MKQAELAMSLADMQEKIDNTVHEATTQFNNMFKATGSDNEQSDLEFSAHNAMVNHLISSSINSKYKKSFDSSKKVLDDIVGQLGTDPNGKAEQTIVLHKSNVFEFFKRQNKDNEQTTVVDLCNALARAGVEKAVVDAAMKQATKPRKGNVYYGVKTIEE
jgi:hypothetical protein